MTCVWNQASNQSLERFSMVLLRSQKMVQDWTSPLMVSWGGRHERAYFDVCVFNPLAPSNRQPLAACYRKHENIKKRAYEQRVCEIEHSSFTPIVLSLTGRLGKAANLCYKRLASMIAAKQDLPYSSTISWICCLLSFSLLRSAIQCIRGARSSRGRAAK